MLQRVQVVDQSDQSVLAFGDYSEISGLTLRSGGGDDRFTIDLDSFGDRAAPRMSVVLMDDPIMAIAQGEELGVPMWVCQAARLVFKHAMFQGAAKEDLTAIVKYVERAAGFEIPKTR